MIKKLNEKDIKQIMKIWLTTNIETHNYISKDYWQSQYNIVIELLPEAEIYIFEENNKVIAFIGIMENYIAGIFVSNLHQSKGIGKKLLDYIKEIKKELSLHVYKKNNNAIRFYERENFIIDSISIDEDTKEEQVLMLWK